MTGNTRKKLKVVEPGDDEIDVIVERVDFCLNTIQTLLEQHDDDFWYDMLQGAQLDLIRGKNLYLAWRDREY